MFTQRYISQNFGLWELRFVINCIESICKTQSRYNKILLCVLNEEPYFRKIQIQNGRCFELYLVNHPSSVVPFHSSLRHLWAFWIIIQLTLIISSKIKNVTNLWTIYVFRLGDYLVYNNATFHCCDQRSGFSYNLIPIILIPCQFSAFATIF